MHCRTFPAVQHLRAQRLSAFGRRTLEQLNPASPERLVISLQFNGWADYYRGQNGHRVSRFAHGLDALADAREPPVRPALRPAPPRERDGHRSPAAANARVLGREFTLALRHRRRRARAGSSGRRPQWYGAVRRRNNGDRSALLGLNGTAGWCVVNTEDAGRQLQLPEAMRRSEFCYSPRGWDQGDSDRYLPAVLHGCVR